MLWVLLGVVALGIGVGFHRFKLYYLISGYRKMTEEQKEETNLKGPSLYFAILTYFIACMFFVLAVLSYFELQTIFSSIFVVIVIVLVGGIMDSQRYMRTLTDENAKPVKIETYKYTKLIGYLCGAGVIVAILIYFAFKPISITIDKELLDISGVYGNTFPVEAIEELKLEEAPLKIVETLNGSTSRNQLQGFFKLQEEEQVLLYINEEVDSYISFTVDGGRVYLNLSTEEQTLALYEQLQQAVQP